MKEKISERLERKLGEFRQQPKIVLVEDNKDDIKMIMPVLLRAHCEAHICETGEGAMALIESVDPDLVLLDLKLPHTPGTQILREIYDKMPCQHVVIMTDPRHLSMLEGYLHGDDYVCIMMKPFTETKVRKILFQHNLIPAIDEDRPRPALLGPAYLLAL